LISLSADASNQLGEDAPDGAFQLDGDTPGTAPSIEPGGSHWNQRRLELRRWLEVNAPSLAPVYVAGVTMAVDETFPGRVWFVAHAIREIRNRLPDALAGEVASSQTDYPGLADKVHARWLDDGLPSAGSPPVWAELAPTSSGPSSVEVSPQLLQAVAELLAGHLAVGETNEAKARRLFESVADGPVPPYVVKTWLRGTRWANAYAHVRNKPLKSDDEAGLIGNFVSFERALMAIASWSYENMDDLDEILGFANR
jgi:hypothetical protein